ncbi:Uncharacterised protein [Moraxella lacunata]|uniref:Uncharacterized protein n=1 Tax=Moraxella lacunata TaxID=477 RepID=A0A1V4H223_MORLA|nr:hypothetical protein [Moraxella lacunata]OPH38905.1 hypothetical protein B5J94_01850 [Moraxella lacunata]STZ00163.1 Uncharacterised protein [Moraxella lacunata]
MQYTAIAKDGGLFIPNIQPFPQNEWFVVEISQIKPQPSHNDDTLDQVIGILKGVDGVEFQNALRAE